MKQIGKIKISGKVTAAAVTVAILFGLILLLLAPVAEASGAPTLQSMDAVFFELGTVGISDPVRVETGEGYYMQPTSYVYLGEVFNSVTGAYETVVCRVLDDDTGNNGASGTMLLYTESAIEPSRFYSGFAETTHLGTENIFTESDLYRKESLKLYFRSQYGRHFEDAAEEEDFLIEITKNDVRADMQGIFTDFLESIDYSLYPDLKYHDYIFTFETDTVDPDASNMAVSSDLSPALNGAVFFPLSAEEFHKYMGSLSKSESYSSEYILTGTPVGYWLRTGIHEGVALAEGSVADPSFVESMEQGVQGSLVLAVDESGKLIAVEAGNEDLYGRFAFNIKAESISYNRIIDGVHKLAFTDPRYADGEDALFDAEIIDTDENGVVTFKYTNAIRSCSNVWYGDDEAEYVSVMITNGEGSVKSYASVSEIPKCYHISDEEKKSSEYFTAQFTLPEDYDESTDSIVIFWERKHDDERKPSFTSNFVELDCAHSFYREDETFVKLPACTELGICVHCGESFGEVDPNNHPNMTSGDYEYDDEANVHWQICPDCFTKGESEECVFPNYCIASCACGNFNEDSEYHSYNGNGICRNDAGHYQKPKMSVSGDYYITVRIENEGNWLWLADKIARGEKQYVVWETYYVYLDADLNFKEIDFIPLGTEENPFKGEINSLGRDFTIENITYSDASADGVGIVAVGENVEIVDICVKNVAFGGKSSVGALVGKAKNVSVDGVVITGSADLTSEDGTCGAFFGSCDSDSSITMSFSYTEEGDEVNAIKPSGNGTPSVDTSYFLAAEDGEGGYLSKDSFASGMVAYTFNQRRPGSGWRQTLDGNDADAYPRRDGEGKYVRITEYCDGTPAVYTNNKKDEMIHYPEELFSFVWDEYHDCEADVFCGKCKQRMLMPADVMTIFEYPKTTYIASIIIDGERVESDPIVVFGIALEEFIGMTELTLTYNGRDVYSDVLMTNTALHESEYVAYFVNSETGKEYMYENYYGDPEPIAISDVGIYDLVVVGMYGEAWTDVGGNWNEDNAVQRYPRDFSGQSVTYEKVLTILPAEVTITPLDVYKEYDGKKSFIPVFTVDNEDFDAYEFDVYLSEASSEKIGDYKLNVTAESLYHEDNVIITLSKSTVTGSIIEKRKVNIENKDYPTSLLYGDDLPTPTADSFRMTEGSEFSYEWFMSVSPDEMRGVHLVPMDDAPVNAGQYVLRAYASPTDSLGGDYVDVEVEIQPVTIEIEYEFSPDAEIVEYRYNTYYFIDSLDQIDIKLSGFVRGDNAENIGVSVYPELSTVGWLDSIEYAPDRNNAYIDFRLEGDNPNYEFKESSHNSDYIISLPGVGLPEIIEEEYGYDYNSSYSEKIWGFRYEFTWQTPSVDGFELDIDEGEHWLYFMTIYDISNGVENKIATDIRDVDLGYLNGAITENHYTVRTNKAGSYLISFEVIARNYYRQELEIPGTEDNKIRFEYYLDIVIDERADGMVDLIEDLGCYTVTVSAYNDFEGFESGEADKTSSYEFIVAKEIKMDLKEIEYNISDGSFNFDKADIYKHVIMEAGGVFRLGHELSDVYINVNTNSGYASVVGFKVVDAHGNDVSYLYKAIQSDSSAKHSAGGIGIAHIFDSPCDTDCNVRGCEYKRVAAHSGDLSGEGSCLKASVCERCGGAYMSVNARHESESLVIRRCGEDITLHELVHSCCGAVSYREEHYSTDKATCKTLAACDGCSRPFGELDSNNHENEASYVSNGAVGHKVSFDCCNKSETEAHFGGTATCKTLAVCEGCKAEYGSLDPTNHSGTPEVKLDPSDSGMHISTYSCCGASKSEAHLGGKASCISKAACDICGASYGELDKTEHASASMNAVVRDDNASMHDAYHSCCNEYVGKFYHTGGIASCAGGAICESCGAKYGDADHSRHASDEYSFIPDELDNTVHIKVFACCGDEIERAQHVFESADCIDGATCTDCGYSDGKLAEHKYPNVCTSVCEVCKRSTRAESFHEDNDGDGACDSCGAEVEKGGISGGGISAIVTGSTVALGAGGFSLFWFVIKKKSLLELLAFFK